MKLLKKYLLEIVVFITGAVVMILEIVGSRILAPYAGGSVIVWTSLIGIILASLSFGYWRGGKLADENPSIKGLSKSLLIASIYILMAAIVKEPVLIQIQKSFSDIRIISVLGTIIILSYPTYLLGMVLPFSVKIKLKNLNKTGETAGHLFAISTIGSIVGTFATGFYLLAYLGNTKILYVISSTLFVLVILTLLYGESKKGTVFPFVFIGVLFPFLLLNLNNQYYLKDVDTQYARIVINKEFFRNKPVLALRTSPKFIQSLMFLNEPNKLAGEYAEYFRLAGYFKPSLKNVLMIGGGAYSYPKDFLKNNPAGNIDVIEIDPTMTEIAKELFYLKDNPRLNIYHQDARAFLNDNNFNYDAILIDAFSVSFSVPFQLTTYEAIERMYESLNEGGVVIMNIIAAIEGEAGKFLLSEVNTFKQLFPQVFIFPVKDKNDVCQVQNIMLIALKSDKIPDFVSENEEYGSYFDHLWKNDLDTDVPILTDDFAPVEQYSLGAVLKNN